ncbi:MAG: hypothetical protein K9M54_01895 [Kiritimatiellales bacterium]|nr:hypothetical protein [Kiritimatiellales bacterium]
MKNMKRKSRWIVLLAGLALFQPPAQAQDQGLGDMMFTAGTVTTAADGSEWAWLQWMATDNVLLKDRPMDIYLKAGNASSLNLFTFKGTAKQTTDPRSIALLLVRGEKLGENLAQLEGAVDSLYSGAAPVESLTLSEKLAAVIDGSQDDLDLYENLVFMGRANPAVSMAIGQAFACKIPSSGYSTFEIRDHNTAEVIGRTTVLAGSPEVLPAPGPLLQILEESPMGHLNVRLRWDVPAALKRVSLLQFGYNLYRIPRAYAEDPARRYDLNPPAYSDIDGLVDGTNVVRVNRRPIVVDADSLALDAYFTIDDNNWDRGGAQFPDGAEYYYFVSALDLLGRDGALSDGLLASPFDRMAPGVPHAVRARAVSEYAGGTRSQWVEVSWAHNPADTDVASYYVYRYASIREMQSNAVYAVSNRISGAITPGSGGSRIKFEDHSLGTNDWNITYWYTVRSADASAGGSNLSGNSAPAFGVLRDWIGPPPATGVSIDIQTEVLTCNFDSVVDPGASTPGIVDLTCIRPDVRSRVSWAEFSYYTGTYRGIGSETNAIPLGRYYFADGTLRESNSFAVAGSEKNPATFFCRVGSSSGKQSGYAYYTQRSPARELVFKGEDQLIIVPVEVDPGPHCWGPGPTIEYPVITIPAVATAKTYRLYRRVDGGRRTLVSQGEMDGIWGAIITDYSGGSVNGGTICYYYQLFDEHGNAGPMILIFCLDVEPRVDLPTPLLEAIDSTGTATAAPGLELNWFCTTPGVERFDVAVAVDKKTLLPTFGTQGYEQQGGVSNMFQVVVGGVTNTLNFGIYRTGRVGTTFGVAGSPQFTLADAVELDRDYTIMVRAIGTTGIEGPWSNAETFHWSTVPDLGPQVPWPARPMPVVQETVFHASLAAQYLSNTVYDGLNGYDKVGIRIGEIPATVQVDQSKDGIYFGKLYDPMAFLYTNAFNHTETVMPCVLYRYQLANVVYPNVSGDVAQVTPLMETIAYGTGGGVTAIYDPFVGVVRGRSSADAWGLYLFDTQPVVRGAKYQYLLMRFNEQTKELDRIIPAGTVTIP